MLPKEITYQDIRPKGFSSDFKEWPIDPMSSNAYWQPNEIVRFLLMLSQGLMDPFRSYFQITVQIDPDLKIGGLQVDSSAQSFINQLVVSSNSVEIERIAEYDTLACFLSDLGFNQEVSQGRDLEGMGASNWVPAESNRFPRGGNFNWWRNAATQGTTLLSQWGSNNTVYPTKAFMSPTVGGQIDSTNASSVWKYWCDQSGSQVSLDNVYCAATSASQVVLNPNGYIANIRAQYLDNWGNQDIPSAGWSVNRNGIAVLGSGNSQNYQNLKNPYWVDSPTVIPLSMRGISLPNRCSLNGFDAAYSQYTGRGAFEPLISNTVPQGTMLNGRILQKPLRVFQRTFLIPVLSAVMGILIPPTQYKLIPLQSLMNMLLQITLNPYAMFSTGYADRNQFDVNGMNTPIPRAFRLLRFQYILNIYYFNGQAIRNYIGQSLLKGITISCTTWMLGSQYQIPNGQIIRNNWIVNSTCQSLSQLLIIFLANDYQRWPFCRKQFRLSNNITQFQLKFNTFYYPPQPIVGNAGNPQPINGSLDNANYYLLLLKSNNMLFNLNTPLPRINRKNFAINDRCYDPSNTKTMCPMDLLTFNQPLPRYPWKIDSINSDTAMGMPYFHQNRFIGKAAFVYTFAPFAHSKQYTMGVDSRQARPFQVLLNTQPTGFFTRDQTMYIFLKHNIIVVYTKDGVVVSGR